MRLDPQVWYPGLRRSGGRPSVRRNTVKCLCESVPSWFEIQAFGWIPVGEEAGDNSSVEQTDILGSGPLVVVHVACNQSLVVRFAVDGHIPERFESIVIASQVGADLVLEYHGDVVCDVGAREHMGAESLVEKCVDCCRIHEDGITARRYHHIIVDVVEDLTELGIEGRKVLLHCTFGLIEPHGGRRKHGFLRGQILDEGVVGAVVVGFDYSRSARVGNDFGLLHDHALVFGIHGIGYLVQCFPFCRDHVERTLWDASYRLGLIEIDFTFELGQYGILVILDSGDEEAVDGAVDEGINRPLEVDLHVFRVERQIVFAVGLLIDLLSVLEPETDEHRCLDRVDILFLDEAVLEVVEHALNENAAHAHVGNLELPLFPVACVLLLDLHPLCVGDDILDDSQNPLEVDCFLSFHTSVPPLGHLCFYIRRC
ncbi:MAG: hypothetical protein ACD_2C00256G0001 [uncultured bacterium (gcode 4)]|uniref:Uncharacterized protein n=1 Tax=uncultured bacterium (gcode 4) TaxID=1234023 RepID=K2GFA2_9BACT|nr:MAG: hypothetical protein ACD_2C00256G0001 [uncultured bacterium (gcode 4)]